MVRVPFAARCARLLVLATVAALSSGIGPATPAAPAQEPRAEGEASQTVVEPLPPEPDATTGAADEEDYERLLEWRYAAQGVPVEGVTIQRDAATWTLESGTVRLAEP
ncbi:MAG: hypothetical protein ACLF0P_10535, partial [Thermoanaerobaculia bacterium]